VSIGGLFTAFGGEQERSSPARTEAVGHTSTPTSLRARPSATLETYGSVMRPHSQVMLDLAAVELARGARPDVRRFARRLLRNQRAQLRALDALQPAQRWPVPREADLRAAGLVTDVGEVFRAPAVDTAFLDRVARMEDAAVSFGRDVLAGRPAPAAARQVRAMILTQQADRRLAGRLARSSGRP